MSDDGYTRTDAARCKEAAYDARDAMPIDMAKRERARCHYFHDELG